MNAHERARQLLLDLAATSIASNDAGWLTTHLAECEQCRLRQEELTASVSVFRAASVNAPPFLAARARTGVRIRSEQLRHASERRLTILIALGFDFVWTTLIIALAVGMASWMGFAGHASWIIIGTLTWLWLAPAIGLLLFVATRSNGLHAAPALEQIAMGGGYRE